MATQAMLARIEKLDPALHAFVTLTADRALADARAAEACAAPRRRSSAARHPDRAQGHLLHARHPHHRRLRAAGRLGARCRRHLRAALAGRGRSCWASSSRTSSRSGSSPPATASRRRATRGTVDHIPGGSSSGSGAALAAGLAAAPPAPTPAARSAGRPRSAASSGSSPPTAAAAGPASSRCRGRSITPGPMARTVEDCALPAAAAGRPRPARSGLEPAPVDDYPASLGRDVRGLRIGVVRNYFFEGVDPEVGAPRSRRRWPRCGGSAPRCATCRSRASTRRPPSC